MTIFECVRGTCWGRVGEGKRKREGGREVEVNGNEKTSVELERERRRRRRGESFWSSVQTKFANIFESFRIFLRIKNNEGCTSVLCT